MDENRRTAEVQYTTKGDTALVQLVVPHGTKLLDLLKVQETLSTKLFPKLTPRGCQTCISGAELRIFERLENVVRIDLESGALFE